MVLWTLNQPALISVQGRGLAEVEARRLLQQLLVALQFSHARGIANRDVKVLILQTLLQTASCALDAALDVLPLHL